MSAAQQAELRRADGRTVRFELTEAWRTVEASEGQLAAQLMSQAQNAATSLLLAEPGEDFPDELSGERWLLTALRDLAAMIEQAAVDLPAEHALFAAVDAVHLDLPASCLLLDCWLSPVDERDAAQYATDLWRTMPTEVRDHMSLAEVISDGNTFTLLSLSDPPSWLDRVPAFAVVNLPDVRVHLLLEASGPLAGGAGEILERIALTVKDTPDEVAMTSEPLESHDE